MEALFIDIGSNTIKSLLAKSEGGRVLGLCEATVAKRISADKSLVPDAAQIIENAVAELKQKAGSFVPSFETVCFGTSALRDFEDAKDVLDFLASKGIAVRVLSGEEEASLSFKGALTDAALGIKKNERIVYADLGGGSMEFAMGTAKGANSVRSLPLGAVRLTKMFGDDFQKISEYCASTLNSIPSSCGSFKFVIAGGAVTAARFILGGGEFSSSPAISSNDMQFVFDTAVKEGAKGLSEKFGTPANRADILPAAFLCLMQVMKHFGKNEFIHTQHSLRYGVAKEFFLEMPQ